MYLISSPLKIPTNKGIRAKQKFFILNLNNYRNANFMVLGNVKTLYTEIMIPLIKEKVPVKLGAIDVSFTYYAPTKRKFDTANITSIHEKFFMDALVESGLLSDDNHTIVNRSIHMFGGYDKENPRVDVKITPLNKIEEEVKFMKFEMSNEDIATAIKNHIENDGLVQFHPNAVIEIDLSDQGAFISVSMPSEEQENRRRGVANAKKETTSTKKVVEKAKTTTTAKKNDVDPKTLGADSEVEVDATTAEDKAAAVDSVAELFGEVNEPNASKAEEPAVVPSDNPFE